MNPTKEIIEAANAAYIRAHNEYDGLFVDRHIHALEAALEAALSAQWIPIDNATEDDKNGYVLGFLAGTELPMVAVWDDDKERWFALNGAFKENWQPTHFMRLESLGLPPPPAQE